MTHVSKDVLCVASVVIWMKLNATANWTRHMNAALNSREYASVCLEGRTNKHTNDAVE